MLPSSRSAAAQVVTWSPSVTLVPARGCFNACGYCHFREPLQPHDPFHGGHSLEDAHALLQRRPGAGEVLLLSGEVAPDSPQRARWWSRLLQFSRLALQHGRLPHTNAGPLSIKEMAALGRLNASMGLMLEGLGPAYDQLHQHAPSKRLDQRIAQLEQAGRLGIPFTTGLLLGVGESPADRSAALTLIAQMQRRWGHIQEVILQPWRPEDNASVLTPGECDALLDTIRQARAMLPEEVHLQLPPNLWPLADLPRAIAAGINDLGGIDLEDVINPGHPQPTPGRLARLLAEAGYQLRPRLCVHRPWLDWLPKALRHRALRLEARLLASETHGWP